MTNGEKIKEIFSNTKIITQYDNPFGDRFMVFTLNNETMQVDLNWWNAKYKEPTTKNDSADKCIDRWDINGKEAEAWIVNGRLQIRNRGTIHNIDLPSVTPQEPRKGYLSIDDVMSVFDDFMCGEVDEEGTETFLKMLIDKVEIESQESEIKKNE